MSSVFCCADCCTSAAGKKSLERELLQLDEQFPDAAKGIVQFSTPLAHQIIAGSDFMLIPSRFEPCGLIQLHAMQYGSVPLVATTGQPCSSKTPPACKGETYTLLLHGWKLTCSCWRSQSAARKLCCCVECRTAGFAWCSETLLGNWGSLDPASQGAYG